jgi:GNAT superfamily N-acetyltransferase
MPAVQPRQLTVTPFDPTDRATLRAWHEVARRCHEVDLPGDPLPTYQESVAHLTSPFSGNRIESYFARDADRLLGALAVEFPLLDNQHAATVDIHVDPPARRLGVGRHLYALATARARAANRTLVIGEVMRNSAGAAFVAALGGELRLPSARRLLSLDSLDWNHLAVLLADARLHAAGYSLVGWAGDTPDEHVEGVAAVMASMNDAPIDDLDWHDEVWDANRIREMDQRTRERGSRRRMLVARHNASGDYAGLTEVMIRGGAAVVQANQGGTVVAPAHRGHRLGLLLKATMLERLRAEEPGVRRIATWNADSNGPMLAINEQLGFEVAETWAEWQATV